METLMIHRSSALGGCLKNQIAAALGMKPIPHDEMSTLRMGEGQLHEDDVIARLSADGYVVTRQQEEVNLGSVQGHLDGIIETATGGIVGTHRVLEIKSMSDAAFKTFQTKGWHGDWPPASLPDRYRWQVSVYQHATGLEALLVTKNRNSGEMVQHGIETPYYSLEQIAERVAYIEDHVARGQLPDDCPHDWFCDFKYLCQSLKSDQGNVSEDEPVNDPMFEQLLSDYTYLTETAKLAESRKAELKADIDAWLKLAGRSKARVGDYQVTWVTREIPESVRKASTQSFPQIKRIED